MAKLILIESSVPYSLRPFSIYTKVLNTGGLSETNKGPRSILLFRALSQIRLNAKGRKRRVHSVAYSLRPNTLLLNNSSRSQLRSYHTLKTSGGIFGKDRHRRSILA